MKIKKIQLKHSSGPKNNQIDAFDFESRDQINLGRSSDSHVQFETDNHTGVSRNHATIKKQGTEGHFTITDNNSMNGVYVNGSRIEGETEIFPGDTVQLGLKGPEFVFDLDPRPPGLEATKLMEVMPATQEVEIEISKPEEKSKDGIGKETFEQAIIMERKKSNFNLVAVILGFMILAAALGFTFKDSLFGSNNTDVTLPEPPPMKPSAAAIAEANINKLVFIETSWKLIHARSGEDIYHEYIKYKDPETEQEQNLPLFMENEYGKLEPVLGLAKDVPNGKPIVSGGTGTGFVIDEKGHIMTNKHVTSSWKNDPYRFPDQEGLLLKYENEKWVINEKVKAPYRWIPGETKLFGREPSSGKIITAENMYLDVTFSKTSQRTKATITRESPEHDLAILKLDLIGNIEAVKFADQSYDVKIGQEIISLGFPSISPDLLKRTTDEYTQKSVYKVVPNPTLANGMISKVMNSSTDASLSKEDDILSFSGDLFQMTINTGAGNSGGPIFNDDGEVIAILNSVRYDYNSTKFSYAVPIKYAMKLMSTQTVIK